MLATALITGLFFTASFGQKETKEIIVQSYQEHSPTKYHTIALEVLNASKNWISAFNNGDVKTCLKNYDSSAIVRAISNEIVIGTKEIFKSLTSIIESGTSNIIYNDISIEVASETTVFLSANWTTNISSGKIYQEKWQKKDDNWVITYHDIHLLKKFDSKKANNTNPIANHLILEEVIKASVKWTNGFNTGKSSVCGSGYSSDAIMNAMPLSSLNGRPNIEDFWKKLIDQGATNLTYHNPIFSTKTDDCVILSAQWSMNIGEGKIYQEKWTKINNQWLLTYDEFQVLKEY